MEIPEFQDFCISKNLEIYKNRNSRNMEILEILNS